MKGDRQVAEELARELGLAIPGPSKSNMADRAIEYVLASGAELFHDQHQDAFIAFQNGAGRREVWPLQSRAASNFIRWGFYREEAKGLSGEALATARGTLGAKALFEGEGMSLAVRVARDEAGFWYDLGDWRAVRITARGWQVVDSPPLLFRHYNHQVPQVEPLPGGSLDQVLTLFNVRGPGDRLLLKVYLVAALLADIPLPVLLVHGEQGSAKTFLLKLLRSLLDPSELQTLAPPDNLRELVQLAAHHRTLYLDNLSRLPEWMSDALCRLCTGDGFSKRELYSDDDDIVYILRGLGGITGINLVVTKPDLLDRALIIRLDPIAEEDRKEERLLWNLFQKMRPHLLGAMFDALSGAMRCFSQIELERLPRLADFARWGVAIAEALGYTGVAFLEAYGVNVANQTEAALEESPVAQAILGFLEQRCTWQGTSTQLVQALEAESEQLQINVKARGWPKGANALARRLREITPSLRRTGVSVEESKSHGIKQWKLSRQGGENTGPTDPIDPQQAQFLIDPVDETPTPAVEIPTPLQAISTPENPPDSFDEGDGGDEVDIFPTITGQRLGSEDQDRRRMSL